MPIVFNEETNAYEGENLAATVLPGFDFSVFGGIISNSGVVTRTITANSNAGIELTNTLGGYLSKMAGSAYAVDLLGNGGRNFFNDGTVFGNVRFGNGWDTMINSGLVQGQIIMGQGNDRLVNQLIPGVDGGETVGTITGGVSMNDGDDTVLNLGVMANVSLGAGDDSYSVFDLFIDEFSGLNTGGGIAGDVRGDAGNDRITGGTADDRFYGGADNDTLSGGEGKDQLYGQNGDDLILGGAGNDKIWGGSGNDFIDGGNNNDELRGGSGDDSIFAGQGNDFVAGGNGNDHIEGGTGNDRLKGNNDNDVIIGGAGHDTMTGGAGADTFVFEGKTGRDIITDFGDGDVIEIFVENAFAVDYADILANISFTGSKAVVDLSSIYNLGAFGSGNDKGSVLTLNNVTAADLDASDFAVFSDILVVG